MKWRKMKNHLKTRVGGGGLGGRGLGEFGFVAFCMAGCKLFPDSDGCLVAEVLEKASSVVCVI
jgi:hypothetical protein